MQEIKLVLCDIDDTLVHKELHLQDSTVGLIKALRRKGVEFTLATGRMPYRAEVFANEAGLDVPFIANNGSILYDRGEFVSCKKVYAGIFKDILHESMEADPEFTVIFSYDDRERPVVTTPWIAERIHKYKGYDEPLGDTPGTWDQEVHKVYIVDDNRTGMIGQIEKRLWTLDAKFSFFRYQQYSMEIVAGGCSKAAGLQTLLKRLRLDKAQVMAVGDHTNDIEMIRMAGIGVAVANAQPELKQVADYVTAAERADGVKEAVQKFVLKEDQEKL